MSPYKIACTAGLAMFAMFFGSGNLVFPLIIGAKTTDQYLLAASGLLITGIIVPFLGLFSMILFHGNKDKYFSLLGRYAPFILSLLILSLLGPFGVVPRCILVAYGGIKVIFPNISLAIFSALFLFSIFLILIQKNQIIPIIGKILGPLKITGIILIIIVAVYQSPELIESTYEGSAFTLGLIEGYQTMDLLAAFFFSITIIEYLRHVTKSKKELISLSISSSIIGGLLIASVYLGFLYLGAHYSSYLMDRNPEEYLAIISHLTLGKYATIIVAIIISISCLATASALLSLFTDFLRVDIAKKKFSWLVSIWTSITISFIMSLIGFATIFKYLEIILSYVYPALISLTICAISNKYFNFSWSKQIFWITVITTTLIKLI